MSPCLPKHRRTLLAIGMTALFIGACAEEPLPVSESLEVELTDANFQSRALESDTPMLVEFGASWCGPCRAMEPALARISVDYADRLVVGKVDVDESLRLAREYNIEVVPTFLILRDGEVVSREAGGMDLEFLTDWIDASLSR